MAADKVCEPGTEHGLQEPMSDSEDGGQDTEHSSDLGLLKSALAAPPKLPESICDISMQTLTSVISWLVSAVHVLDSNIAGRGARFGQDDSEQHDAEFSKAIAAQLSKLESSFEAHARAQEESSSVVNELQEQLKTLSASSGQFDQQFDEAVLALEKYKEWTEDAAAEQDTDMSPKSFGSDEEWELTPDGKKKRRKGVNRELKPLYVSRNFLDLKNQRGILSLGREYEGLCKALEAFEIAVKDELRLLGTHINAKAGDLASRKELHICASGLESKILGCTSALEAKLQQAERVWQSKLETTAGAWHSKLEKARKAQAASDAFRDEKWDDRFSGELCSLREQIRQAESKVLQVQQAMLSPAPDSSNSSQSSHSVHHELSVRVDKIEKKLSAKPVTLESLGQVDLTEEVQRLRIMVECMQTSMQGQGPDAASLLRRCKTSMPAQVQDEFVQSLRGTGGLALQSLEDQLSQQLRSKLEKRLEEQQVETSGLVRNCQKQIEQLDAKTAERIDDMSRRLPRLASLLKPVQADSHLQASRPAWQSVGEDDVRRALPDESATLMNLIESSWKSTLNDVQAGVAAEMTKFRSDFEASVISQITALSSRVDAWSTQAPMGPFRESTESLRKSSKPTSATIKPTSATRRSLRDLPQDQANGHSLQLGSISPSSVARAGNAVGGERPKSRGGVRGQHERCVTPNTPAMLRASQSLSRLPVMRSFTPL